MEGLDLIGVAVYGRGTKSRMVKQERILPAAMRLGEEIGRFVAQAVEGGVKSRRP